ncbi:MAG: PAS domain-containing sensor histidine kinase [Pseudomonadota bacterium]
MSTEGSSADDDGATTVAVGGAAAAAGAAAAGPANETDGDIESADKPSTDEPVSETGVLVPEHNVDTSILARLPIPVLVYRDDELLFANPDFTNITGYRDLHALAEVGGVERLFGGPDDRLTGDSASPIFHANGERLPVRAHIQKVPWDANPAMLLTLRPGQGRDDGPPAPEPDTGGSGQRFAVVQGGGGVSASFGDLEASELSGIVDTASDGVLILSAAGMVQAASRSAEALFDRPAQEIEGVELASLLAPESRASARDYLDGLQQTGLARLLNDGREVMLRTPRGGLVPVFMTIGQLGESNERFCAVMRDITPWKRSEEDLLRAKANAEEASQQKSHFLARISHEIRTPLNAIIGFSDMMVAERFGRIESDRYRGYLRDISRSGHHVLEIVNDLLDISKIEAGQLDLAFDTCDLNTIVSNTVAMMQADANKDRVIIRTSLSAAVPKVVADPRSLRQVILNLVSNGIKYTRAGGQVIVSTVLDEGGAVTLRVRDTGIGMSASDLDQAMQPFQRITTTPPLDRVPEGTGLGLPLTRALVEANRAQFHIESEPEEGTMVEVRFQAQRVLADR